MNSAWRGRLSLTVTTVPMRASLFYEPDLDTKSRSLGIFPQRRDCRPSPLARHGVDSARVTAGSWPTLPADPHRANMYCHCIASLRSP